MHSAALRIVLVDDHEVLRSGVRGFLDSLPGYEIVGEASGALAALRMIESTRPDVVLMDLALPGMDGLVATREILWRLPSTRVIVLSARERIQDVRDAIDAGAIGYVLKGDPPQTLADALDHAARGMVYVPPGLARQLPIVMPSQAMQPARPTQPTDDALDVLNDGPADVLRPAADRRATPEITRKPCAGRKIVGARLPRSHRKQGRRTAASPARS